MSELKISLSVYETRDLGSSQLQNLYLIEEGFENLEEIKTWVSKQSGEREYIVVTKITKSE